MPRPLVPYVLAGLAAAFWPATPAQAQYGGAYTGGILPTVGTNTRVNNLRPQLESYFNAQAAPPSTIPAWIVTPSIGVDVGATDNALRINSPRRADLFTIISPAVAISGDTPRLKVGAIYSPQYTVYASESSQTRFNQFGNGNALAILVPDAVFLDVRGSVTQTSLTGNEQFIGSTQTNNRQDLAQTYAFSITPYAEHRFGGWGTARIGYSYSRTLQDTLSNDNLSDGRLVNNNPSLQGFGPAGYGAIGNLTTQRERASFVTGENLGRINNYTVVEAIQYSGGGSYRGAHRNQFNNEIGYALTRELTLLAGIGYQDIRYGGTPAFIVNEPTWNAGVRYTPNQDSSITVLYGRRDAITSVSLDGFYAPTARTRIIARYSTGLTTDIEEAQNVLSSTSVGPTGLVTDTATGAPVGASSGFGIQNGVFKLKRFSATGLLLQNRDTFSISVVSEDRTTVTTTPNLQGTALIPSGTSSTSLNTSAFWSHELTPVMSTTAGLQYAVTNNTEQFLGRSGGQQTTFSATAALSRQFTETLTGSVRYTYTDQSGGTPGTFQFNPAAGTASGLVLNRGSYTENLVLVGVRKSF